MGPKQVEYFLNLARGGTLRKGCTGERPESDWCRNSDPLEYRVFEYPENSFQSDIDLLKVDMSKFKLDDLFTPAYAQLRYLKQTDRYLSFEIGHRSYEAFFRIKNSKFIFYGGTPVPPDVTRKTLQKVMNNLARGRILAINVKRGLFDQHVILIRDAKQTGPDAWEFAVTSNATNLEGTLKFENGKFSYEGETSQIFVVDEDQMDRLQEVNYFYYQNLCEAPNPQRLLPAEEFSANPAD